MRMRHIFQKKSLEDEIDKMLDLGVIRPSRSPYSSRVVLVPKKGGGTRFAIDYREINKITKDDAYPLPNINEILDMVAGSSLFSCLDLTSAYWQLPMARDSIPLTAFVTHRGLYEFVRCPYGLKQAPSVFQRFMNSILAPVSHFCLVYIDDVIIFSKSKEEHDDHLRQVFELLDAAHMQLKPSKCNLRQSEAQILGHVVSEKGISPDPEKTSAFRSMPAPVNRKEVRSFLGMCGYYMNLIPDYALVAGPLTNLKKEKVKFHWGIEQERAFQHLKTLMCSDLIVAAADPNKSYKLYTDACAYAIGSILVQEDENGIERPIQYVSKQLQESQMRWPPIEREAFSIFYSIRKLHHYLYGARLTILTDHVACKCIFLQENKNSRVQRWSIALAEMGAEIQHRPGKNHLRADMLSRLRHTSQVESRADGFQVESDDDEIIRFYEEIAEVLECDPFHCHCGRNTLDTPYSSWYTCQERREMSPSDFSTEYSEVSLLEDITPPWEFDNLHPDDVKEEQQGMEEYDLGRLDMDDYTLIDGLLHTLNPPPGKDIYPRLVLPPSTRERCIRRAHLEVGHQRMRKTMDRLNECYKWPKMTKDVQAYLSRCATCQANYVGPKDYPRPANMPIAKYPGQMFGIDLTGKFMTSPDGNNYVLTAIDYCSGWVEMRPVPSKHVKHMLKFIEEVILPDHGPPEVVVCDNAYRNTIVSAYLTGLGCDVRYCTPYHPESNSRCERSHKTIKSILRKLNADRGQEWERHLYPALWAYRISTSTVTSYSPYQLIYGRYPISPKQKLYSYHHGDSPEELADRMDALSQAFIEAARRTEESRLYNLERLENRATGPELRLGDTVMIYVEGKAALDRRYDGPYVVSRIRNAVITVVGARGERRTVNRKLLKKVNPYADFHNLNPRVSGYTRRKQDKLLKEQHQQPVPQPRPKEVPERQRVPTFAPPERIKRQPSDTDPPVLRRSARLMRVPAGLGAHIPNVRPTEKRPRDESDDTTETGGNQTVRKSPRISLQGQKRYREETDDDSEDDGIQASKRIRDTEDDGIQASTRINTGGQLTPPINPSSDEQEEMQIDHIEYIYSLRDYFSNASKSVSSL